jgi:uncharacterized membrane protein
MLKNPRAKRTVWLTSLLYFSVLVTLTVTTFYPAPIAGVSVILILSVKLLPLLALLSLVLRGDNRGYIWLAFVVIFYFTQAAVSAWLSEGAAGPVILTALTLLLFVMAMVHLKINRPAVD